MLRDRKRQPHQEALLGIRVTKKKEQSQLRELEIVMWPSVVKYGYKDIYGNRDIGKGSEEQAYSESKVRANTFFFYTKIMFYIF